MPEVIAACDPKPNRTLDALCESSLPLAQWYGYCPQRLRTYRDQPALGVSVGHVDLRAQREQEVLARYLAGESRKHMAAALGVPVSYIAHALDRLRKRGAVSGGGRGVRLVAVK